MITALRDRLDPGLAHPRVRDDAEIGERATRWSGREAIIHAPGTAYLRLTGAEADVVRTFDGSRTLAEAAAADFDDPDGLSVDDVVALVADIGRAGLLDRQPVDLYASLRDRLAPARHRRRRRLWAAAREQTIAISQADRLFTALYRRGGSWLFSAPVVVVFAALAVGGVAILLVNDEPIVSNDVAGGNALLLFSMLLGVLFLHECGHALAVKRAGRDVVRAGFMLYLGHPAFFVDSTDLAFATRRQRAVNAVAGPFVEAAVAGLAVVVAWATEASFANDLYRFAALSYFNVALNLVPFLELDGYWLLTDLLDTPHLRARSFALLRHDAYDRLRGRRPPFTRAERAVAAFGLLGLACTAIALALAFTIWFPLAGRLLSAGWDAGPIGRFAVVLIVAVAAGPMLHAGGLTARWLIRAVGRVADDVRFRTQTKWRVEAATAIAALPHADELDDDVLSELAGRVQRRRVREGVAVVRQGEAADAFFVVRRGSFDVVERGPDGEDRLIRRLSPGESFGEIALLERRPRTATVRATTDAEVFVLDAGAFTRLLAPSLGEPALLPTLGPALEVRALPTFRRFSLDDAATIAERGEWLDVAAGASVVTQGEAADGFYVLLAGQAEVERDGEVVARLRAGGHFGETALLKNERRNATVRATTPARVLRVDNDTFHALVAAAVTRHDGSVASTDRTLGGAYA
ncbi:MAG: cyclic nucleotide-binding domain-containing protein [Acidimicrobiales bacterium]|nr:cyclic nucleotide-binding domain-containing protein [Acidimicrobiales bacterium]